MQHQQRAGELKEVGSFDLVETIVTSMEFVKGINNLIVQEEQNEKSIIDGDSVWMGTASKKIFIYSATNPEQDKQIAVCSVPAAVTQIVFHMDSTFVALSDGTVQIFRRGYDGHWLLKEPQTVSFGVAEPITSILSINANVYAGCGQKVYVPLLTHYHLNWDDNSPIIITFLLFYFFILGTYLTVVPAKFKNLSRSTVNKAMAQIILFNLWHILESVYGFH